MTTFVRIGLGGLLTSTVVAPAWAQAEASAALPMQTLLVVAVLLSVCLLVVSSFALWQSHRTYVETVRLHQRIAEDHQTFLARALQLRPAPRSDGHSLAGQVLEPTEVQTRAPGDRASSGPPADRVRAPVPPASPVSEDPGASLADLNDVEFAVLEKLASDPGFFTSHPLHVFGADQRTIDGLLHRGLAARDGLGRPSVPREVQAAMKAWLPRN